MDGARVAEVAVPASSANLGPGFDALAVALDLHLRVRTAPFAGRRVTSEGDGADELPGDESNLIWRAFAAFCAWAGVPTPDVALHVHNGIPLERGLGSSAAAAVAGVALARVLTSTGATDADVLQLAAGIEGHPDNAAAALHGGLVLCTEGRALRFTPARGLRPVLCVPQERQSTEAARGILPASVALADAAAGGARTAGVLAGLLGLVPLDAAVMTDVLHEPARFAAMPATGALVRRLREAGVPSCLSGAGPSVLAVVGACDAATAATLDRLAGDGWVVRPAGWDLAGAVARVAPATRS